MAIKINLAKAFNRVEWNLLVIILRNLGFYPTFINWIHQCISTYSISFFINGAHVNIFKPSRGLWQGDPLSPFLFILYTEVLSRVLCSEQDAGIFKSIKISRTAFSISNLLYADELIFFAELLILLLRL